MKILALLFVGLFTQVLIAGELPWIGVSLNPPTSEEREKVSLDHGVGFQVGAVTPNGPLAKAGGKEGDLWWKFDGQILVNKSQMVVLLRGKEAGEKVIVDFYREGELQRLNLALEARQRPNIIPVNMAEERPLESRVLAKREQIARITLDENELSLENEGEKWRFRVKEGGTTVLSALAGDDDLGEKIPLKWHGAYLILRQTLESSSRAPGEKPKRRVRYVVPHKTPVK